MDGRTIAATVGTVAGPVILTWFAYLHHLRLYDTGRPRAGTTETGDIVGTTYMRCYWLITLIMALVGCLAGAAVFRLQRLSRLRFDALLQVPIGTPEAEVHAITRRTPWQRFPTAREATEFLGSHVEPPAPDWPRSEGPVLAYVDSDGSYVGVL
jgi:hypothetical protein